MWLFFSAGAPFVVLSPGEFQIALALRLSTLPAFACPEPFPHHVPCSCGRGPVSRDGFVDHALRCAQFTSYAQTLRHNDVRDAMAAVARSYGVTTTVEPRFYDYDDSGGVLRRPDITFHLPRRLTTDVTVVMPGLVEKAAAEKDKDHTMAVARMGDTFVPFAMDVFGFRHDSCFRLVDAMAVQLPAFLRRPFRFDMWSAVSCALAKARALAVLSSLRRHVLPLHRALVPPGLRRPASAPPSRRSE
jgi:hypothetical protein